MRYGSVISLNGIVVIVMSLSLVAEFAQILVEFVISKRSVLC